MIDMAPCPPPPRGLRNGRVAIGLPAVIERLHCMMQTSDGCEGIHILVELAKASFCAPLVQLIQKGNPSVVGLAKSVQLRRVGDQDALARCCAGPRRENSSNSQLTHDRRAAIRRHA
jgi:hypothetical protein